MSPLMFAARAGKAELLQKLLSANAEVNAQDLVRNTSLHEAAAQGHVECIGLLLHAKADLRIKGHHPSRHAVGIITPTPKTVLYADH